MKNYFDTFTFFLSWDSQMMNVIHAIIVIKNVMGGSHQFGYWTVCRNNDFAKTLKLKPPENFGNDLSQIIVQLKIRFLNACWEVHQHHMPTWIFSNGSVTEYLLSF